jgi:prepilin-type N-terminal cleavage/methylation domain-containing protein
LVISAPRQTIGLRASKNRAFTLFELMIVLVLIVVAAAVAWPAMRMAMEKSTLVNAAKQLSSDLTRTRLAAIETGTIQQFCFQPGGKRYEIGPPPADQLQAMITTPEELASVTPEECELPEGVRFFVPGANGEPTVDEGGASIVVAGEWSAPVVFQPSGRGTNARVRLLGSQGLYVEVFVRGLTGVARVGPVLQEETP